MNFWPFSRKSNADGSVATSLDLFRLLQGSFGTSSGLEISSLKALEVNSVMACARLIAEGLSQVPFQLYQQSGINKNLATDHPLYDVLYRKPNGWQSSFEFREVMTMHAVLGGQAFAFINRRPDGSVGELIPLLPGSVEVIRMDDWTLKYRVTTPSGEQRLLESSAVWHWRGPSWDGVIGLNAVRLARESIGLAMATEKSHAIMHKNGSKVSGTYSVEGTLGKEGYESLTTWINKNFAGVENAHKIMVLDRNAKFMPQTQSGIDSQHIETRKYQVEEICRAFRVYPVMVGYSDKAATYASAEQMFLAHVVYTLSPWYSRVEQSAEVQLLTDKERRDGYFVKFNAAGLMRGSHKDRSEYFAKALGEGGGRGWMTQDEVRGLDELNPMGGDAATLPIPPQAGTGAQNGT